MDEPCTRAGCPVGTIALDFDGTLINEHVLTRWVRFILLESEMTIARKCVFLFDSFVRGGLSLIFASRIATSVWAVKLAYRTFRGIDINTIEEMINYQDRKGVFALTLNTAVLRLLKDLLAGQNPKPRIEIHSQGSFAAAIRSFLKRRDVAARLKALDIPLESIAVFANTMAVDRHGKFTGRLRGGICTKFSRIKNLKTDTLFIGDDKDEAALHLMDPGKFRFLNWKKWGVRGPVFLASVAVP